MTRHPLAIVEVERDIRVSLLLHELIKFVVDFPIVSFCFSFDPHFLSGDSDGAQLGLGNPQADHRRGRKGCSLLIEIVKMPL